MSLDPACHAECLEFIRVAIAEASSTTAHEITAVLKEVCTPGPRRSSRHLVRPYRNWTAAISGIISAADDSPRREPAESERREATIPPPWLWPSRES